ncbi:MAG: PP2C family protein-serine/threonine phosphatase [Candidatus Gracilibacteria bacterium]
MSFIRKSIVRRLFFHLLGVAVAISAIMLFMYYFRSDWVEPHILLPGGVGLFLVYVMVACYVDFVRPLKVVLTEMQSLLTGGVYKKIYTNRVDEIGVIAYFFNKVTEGFGQVSFDVKDRQRMLGELNLAAQLQRDILPQKIPEIPGLQIVAKTKPATEIGGDIFNFITVKDKTYIYIGDATGHGTVAGLVMTMVNSLITVFSDHSDSAYEILVNVNKYLKRWLKKAVYMTLVMLCWDHKTQKMTYVGAGHEHVIVYHTATGECEAILSGGIALGMIPDNSKVIKEQELKYEETDYIVLYTDGITEAKGANGELYGLNNLKNAVIEYSPQYSAEGVNFHIAKDVSTYMGNIEQNDDMTLIVIKRDKDFKQGAASESTSISWQA